MGAPKREPPRRGSGTWTRLVSALVLGASALGWAPADGPTARAPSAQPPRWPSCRGCNLLLISIDTLRADRLGCYGNPRGLTPRLDALARRALVFERAYSTSYVTADSHMSVFTSLYPSAHGVRNALPDERTALRLPESVPTLTELLRAQGYATAGVTGGGNVSGLYGFDRGMDSYESPTDADVALRRALALLGQPRSSPFFLFFHTYHPHDPYTPSRQAAQRFAGGYAGRILHERSELAALRADDSFSDARRAFWSLVDKQDPRDVAHLSALYDAEVSEVDRTLAQLVRRVRQRAPHTLIVVISDHGEQFGEHGGFLHNELYEELVRVPLVIAHPGGAGAGRVGARVSLVDLAPTLLDLLGLPAPESFEGRSLRGVALGSEPSRPIFAEKAGKRAMRIEGDRKLIAWLGDGGTLRRHVAFDLARDPGERRPDQPALETDLAALDQTLARGRARARALQAEHAARPVDARTVERLRALGYAR